MTAKVVPEVVVNFPEAGLSLETLMPQELYAGSAEVSVLADSAEMEAASPHPNAIHAVLNTIGPSASLSKKTWREKLGFGAEMLPDGDDLCDAENSVPRPKTNRPWRLGILSCLSTADGAGIGISEAPRTLWLCPQNVMFC